jgi:flagella basal body P-ring formation protein FlgA
MGIRIRIGTAVTALLLAAAGAVADATVRLDAEARLGTDWVRLGDLGTVEAASAEEAEAVGDLFLGPAPLAGAVRTVTRGEIVRRLRERGLARMVRLAGADSVRVARGAGGGTARAAGRSAGAETGDADPVSGPDPRPETPMEAARLRALVTELVRRSALARTGRDDARAEVRILQVEEAAARGATAARLAHVSGRLPGRATVAVLLLDAGGRPLAETEARVDASVRVPVVTLRRGLRRGEPIRSGDVRLEAADWREGVTFLPPETEVFEGRVAARTLGTGVPLKEGDLERPALVQRNKPVVVTARAGGFEVRTAGRALQEGRAGEVVTVENPETQRRYLARVVGFARVEALVEE